MDTEVRTSSLGDLVTRLLNQVGTGLSGLQSMHSSGTCEATLPQNNMIFRGCNNSHMSTHEVADHTVVNNQDPPLKQVYKL